MISLESRNIEFLQEFVANTLITIPIDYSFSKFTTISSNSYYFLLLVKVNLITCCTFVVRFTVIVFKTPISRLAKLHYTLRVLRAE